MIIKILSDMGFVKGVEFAPDARVTSEDAFKGDVDEEGIHSYNEVNDKALEIDLRDKEFDDRIARIKLELSKSEKKGKRSGVTAEIGEEGIYNLPHDDVDVYPSTTIDDLEVSN